MEKWPSEIFSFSQSRIPMSFLGSQGSTLKTRGIELNKLCLKLSKPIEVVGIQEMLTFISVFFLLLNKGT